MRMVSHKLLKLFVCLMDVRASLWLLPHPVKVVCWLKMCSTVKVIKKYTSGSIFGVKKNCEKVQPSV